MNTSLQPHSLHSPSDPTHALILKCIFVHTHTHIYIPHITNAHIDSHVLTQYTHMLKHTPHAHIYYTLTHMHIHITLTLEHAYIYGHTHTLTAPIQRYFTQLLT
jgi:hypothetical protein